MGHEEAVSIKTSLQSLLLICLCLPQSFAQDGSATGWWTDSDGNNYYGDPSSGDSTDGDNGDGSRSLENLRWLDEQRDCEEYRQWEFGNEANKRGNAFYAVQDWNNAIASYEEALRHDPHNQVIKENLQQAIDARNQASDEESSISNSYGLDELFAPLQVEEDSNAVVDVPQTSDASYEASILAIEQKIGVFEEGYSFLYGEGGESSDSNSDGLDDLFAPLQTEEDSSAVVVASEVFEVSEDLKDAPANLPTDSMRQKTKEANAVLFFVSGKGFDNVASLSPEWSWSEADAAVSHLPVDAREHTVLAAAAVGLGRYGQAIDHLEKAERAAPAELGIQNALGHVIAIRDGQQQPFQPNSKTQILLDALEHGQGNWLMSISYLQGRLDQETNPDKIKEIADNIEYANGLGAADTFIKNLIEEKYGANDSPAVTSGLSLEETFLQEMDSENLEQQKRREHEQAWAEILTSLE